MEAMQSLFEEAQKYIPGGVNSPVRAFKAVGGTPVYVQRAQGAYIFDTNDKKYIDYIGSWGPMILGHANPEVIKAVQDAAPQGLSFGCPTTKETELAKLVCNIVPSIEKIRMVSSGTEATMSAIRLARGFTNRSKILKFEGCYHGHADSLLVKAGSGALTFGMPSSPGVPAELAEHTLTLPFNSIDHVRALFAELGEQIACIIVEPIAGNINCIPPKAGFLQGLREVCDEYQSLLIFDEVMTGFRVAKGGAQEVYKVTPDLTTLGKVIGGGMPVGAFGGRADIMDYLAPNGPVYQAGTLSGNPIAMTAGLTTLNLLNADGFYQALSAKAEKLVLGLQACAHSHNIPMATHHVGGMFGFFFTDVETVETFEHVTACNFERFNQFFQGMLAAGVYLAPSAYEAGFISAAHTEADIQTTLQHADDVFRKIA